MSVAAATIPLWFKLTYTAFVLVLVPFYAAGHGFANFLWFSNLALHLRLLSLYHLFIPWILFWLSWRLGYDPQGWKAQTLFAWIILLLCFFVTDPERNINWSFGLGDTPQESLPPALYLALMMMGYPLLVYFPTHLLVLRVMRRLPAA